MTGMSECADYNNLLNQREIVLGQYEAAVRELGQTPGQTPLKELRACIDLLARCEQMHRLAHRHKTEHACQHACVTT